MSRPTTPQTPAFSTPLKPTESKVDFIYKHAPVGIWEEDWSQVKNMYDSLPEYDKNHFEEYLNASRSHVERFKRTTKVISVNPAALKAYGYTEEEHDQFIQEYDVYISDFISDAVAFTQGNFVSAGTSEEIDRHGNKLIFRDIYCIPEEFQHNWERVICISQEISDASRRERIASEQLRHLEMAAKIAKIGYWTAEFGEQSNIHISGQYLAVLEIEHDTDSIEPDLITNAIHPEDKQRVLNIYNNADKNLQNFSVDYRIITKTGSMKYLREIGEIISNEHGQPFAHHGIIQDITAEIDQQQRLDKADQTVRQLEDQFIGAINALKVGIALFNNDHQLIKANNYFSYYFNEFDLDIEQNNSFYNAIKKLVNKTQRSNEAEQKADQWQQWFEQPNRSSFEYFDGYNWLTISKELLKDQTYVITLSDISDLKDRERLLQEKQNELELLATKDALTNIYNRRKFNESLNHEFRRSMRTRSSLSLIMCDIDFFKKYNDLYGHLKGDDCLKIVANTINDCFNRASDVVSRYGGEEFAIILPNTDQQLANQLAQKVCSAVKNRNIPHELSDHNRVVTISVGVSTMDDCFNHSQIELIDTADNALYEAKDQGRNCVRPNLYP